MTFGVLGIDNYIDLQDIQLEMSIYVYLPNSISNANKTNTFKKMYDIYMNSVVRFWVWIIRYQSRKIRYGTLINSWTCWRVKHKISTTIGLSFDIQIVVVSLWEHLRLCIKSKACKTLLNILQWKQNWERHNFNHSYISSKKIKSKIFNP